MAKPARRLEIRGRLLMTRKRFLQVTRSQSTGQKLASRVELESISFELRPPARQCARAGRKSPVHGQLSSFTAPFKVVLAADIMSDKMQMFPFCSNPTEESSNRRNGNIILNIRNQQNTEGNQANNGRGIFFRESASATPFV